LALRDAPGSTIAVPINMPTIFEQIACKYNSKIIRTETDPNMLIKATIPNKVLMAGDGRGNFIFSDFHSAFDGLMALAKTIEFLSTQKVSLGNVVANLPHYFMAERRVSCTWEAKARVMRLINEKFQKHKHPDVVNGVKIELSDKKWILILPDADQPYFRITVEGETRQEAESLVDEYTRTIEKLVD